MSQSPRVVDVEPKNDKVPTGVNGRAEKSGRVSVSERDWLLVLIAGSSS